MGRSGPLFPLSVVIGDLTARAVVSLRGWFVYVVAHLVSWLVLSPSPGHFTATQLRDMPDSTAALLNIQAHRTPLFDRLFKIWTRSGSEGFYCLLLPVLYWTMDIVLARRLTYVVVFGIAAGNVLKDIFLLPRPASPPVWVPSSLLQSDSARLADFGFPSTHAINAVTNPVFIIGHLVVAGYISLTSPWMALVVVAGVAHCVLLCASRLYLGCVFIGDVKAGLVLGALVMCVATSGLQKFDSWFLNDAEALPVYFLVVVGILSMCPQPRPRTASFLQTVQLMGVSVGNAFGAVMAANGWGYGASALASVSATSSSVSFVGAALRVALGGAVCLLLSTVFSDMLVVVVQRVFSVRLSPHKWLAVGSAEAVRAGPPAAKKAVADAKLQTPQTPTADEPGPETHRDPNDSPHLTRQILAEGTLVLLYSAAVTSTVTTAVPCLFNALKL